MKKTLTIISILCITGLTYLGRKVYTMVADPLVYLKDCTPLNHITGTTLTNNKPLQSLIGLISFAQIGGTINDASCLNRTQIAGIIKVTNENNIKQALAIANKKNMKISVAGERHSMGGQTFCQDCIVLDMRHFDKIISLDQDNKTITVQPGISRKNIQETIDPYGLSVQAMQSINMFTVGGSIAVNAHGIAHNPGSIASTVISMKILTAAGESLNLSNTENNNLFSSVIGGYGLYGIITEVTLQLTDNEQYNFKREYMHIDSLENYYKEHLQNNTSLGLLYGRISVGGRKPFHEIYINTYSKIEGTQGATGLSKEQNIILMRLIINTSKQGSRGKGLRRLLEKYLEPHIKSCNNTRNILMSNKEDCIVVKNQEMYDTMYYLKNRQHDTDVLQEYFIPISQVTIFIEHLKEITQKNNNNLLNITLRFGKKDTISKLPYFKEDDMVALVLYFNLDLSKEQSISLEKTTKQLIDDVISLGGTYYLPYQLHATKEQLKSAYPNIEDFFNAKKTYDPQEIFVNKFYLKYK